MKALPCPGCGAPLAVKKGIAAVKCSFCDLDVRPDFNTALEFQGLTNRQISKLVRRAEGSVKRELYTKALKQYSALAELTESNLDHNYIKFQSLAYSLKIKEYLHSNYNITNGLTLDDIENESKYASFTKPSFSYARLDVPMLETIEEVEDKCENMPAEIAEKIALETFIQIKEDMIYIGLNAVIYIYIYFSYYEEEISNGYTGLTGFGDYTKTCALPEAVHIAMKLKCEIFNMLFNYLETINIGDTEEAQFHKGGLISLAVEFGSEDIDLTDQTQKFNDHPSPYKLHPSPYKLIDLADDEVIEEFLTYVKKYQKEWQSFYEYYAEISKQEEEEEKERIRKEEEEKERIRLEKIEKEKIEREEKERIRKMEEEKKLQEWLASPEYKDAKKRNAIFNVLLIIIATFYSGFIINAFIQKNNNIDRVPYLFYWENLKPR
tara:strand:+ start:468 stop:1775 length:1308 start_codon:yes stop_codon:yes gene_type:complete